MTVSRPPCLTPASAADLASLQPRLARERAELTVAERRPGLGNAVAEDLESGKWGNSTAAT